MGSGRWRWVREACAIQGVACDLLIGWCWGQAAAEDWGPALLGLMPVPPTPTPAGHELPRTENIPFTFPVPSVLPRAQHGVQEIYVVEKTKSLRGAEVRVRAAPWPLGGLPPACLLREPLGV